MVALPSSGELRGILEARGALVPAGYSSLFGTTNFDWQAQVIDPLTSQPAPNKMQVVDVTAETVVGTYKVHVGTAAVKNSASLSFTPPAAGHSETYKITGIDGSVCQFTFSNDGIKTAADMLNEAITNFNALTSHSGLTAQASTLVPGNIDLTAVKAGNNTFRVQKFDDAPVPNMVSDQTCTGGSNVIITDPGPPPTSTVKLDQGGGVTKQVAITKVDGNQITLDNGLVLNVTAGSGEDVHVNISKREGQIADIRRKLNKLAMVFASELNKKHMEGVSLEAIQNSPNKILEPSGIRFFVDAVAYHANASNLFDPVDMEHMIVNPLLDNSAKVAAARPERDQPSPPRPSVPYEGNSDNSREIAQLKYQKFGSFPQPSTCDDYYRTVSGDLGVSGQQAERMYKNQTMLTDTVMGQRDSVTSVSLDEEMTNMIRFQQAYNAAARMVNAVDEMIDTIINRMGMVGR
ncbi:hypothetical protein GTO91_07135 [Heliobacterium undosum]|uniref:Flagellar basal-body/hook protein C-terminal domain-containing protein n=2 Tax=Heliomicrobium undosum TaxID=121734 RepID=A0A845L6W1_9FIRM|nr:hypothetical protein [Heliomicrobium undosum]